MSSQLHAPGVYLQEGAAFTSIVEAQTAIPAFIGFTETARDGEQDLTNTPTRITSLAEFRQYFAETDGGGAPHPRFDYSPDRKLDPPYASDPDGPHFKLYHSLQLFFDNGGGQSYIVSVGSYATRPGPDPFLQGLDALTRQSEPTMVLMPDAVLLGSDDWRQVSQTALRHCGAMGNRIAILDVRNGFRPANGGDQDPIAGKPLPRLEVWEPVYRSGGFHSIGGADGDVARYGAAYYPWIHTRLVKAEHVDYSWLSAATLPVLKTALKKEAPTVFPPIERSENPRLAPYLMMIDGLAAVAPDAPAESSSRAALLSCHRALMQHSIFYQQAMAKVLVSANLLPPSGAMAGVIVRNDQTAGVHMAPVNTTVVSASAPAVLLSDAAQDELNVPANGVAVNTLRSFPGKQGVMVWGARTLDGNSQQWRYLKVVRTAIMLEQSIRVALKGYVAQPNSPSTWAEVKDAIDGFLTTQWQRGVLVGSRPEQAFSVNVGLHAGMDPNDILDGWMTVRVGLALTQAGEFVEIDVRQRMQPG